jgi:hypothetical protein
MIKTETNNLIKMARVLALLAGSVAFCDSAFAINLTISNTTFNTTTGGGASLGQSFINDPTDSSTVYLNSWIFSFANATAANTANALTLNVYSGIGNVGTLVGSSIGSATTTFNGQNSVVWTLPSIALTANSPYTVAMIGNTTGGLFNSTDVYGNGTLVNLNQTFPNSDMVFQGQFSAAPIPFGFEPTGGLAILGGAWLLHKRLQKKATQKQEQ